MTSMQRFLMSVLPRPWAQAMRAESQRWTLVCTCGHGRSIWEAGGVRWKARGNPRRLLACPACGQVTWHKVEYRAGPPGGS